MNVVVLLVDMFNFSDDEILVCMNGNFCCCGIYICIYKVIKMVVEKMSQYDVYLYVDFYY